MLSRQHLQAIKVASQIASVIGAVKVAATVAYFGYQWYYDEEARCEGEEEKQREMDESEREQMEGQLVCPLTKEAIREPALTSHGILFEKAAIERYVRDNA